MCFSCKLIDAKDRKGPSYFKYLARLEELVLIPAGQIRNKYLAAGATRHEETTHVLISMMKAKHAALTLPLQVARSSLAREAAPESASAQRSPYGTRASVQLPYAVPCIGERPSGAAGHSLPEAGIPAGCFAHAHTAGG